MLIKNLFYFLCEKFPILIDFTNLSIIGINVSTSLMFPHNNSKGQPPVPSLFIIYGTNSMYPTFTLYNCNKSNADLLITLVHNSSICPLTNNEAAPLPTILSTTV